jgi:hypothetical protein
MHVIDNNNLHKSFFPNHTKQDNANVKQRRKSLIQLFLTEIAEINDFYWGKSMLIKMRTKKQLFTIDNLFSISIKMNFSFFFRIFFPTLFSAFSFIFFTSKVICWKMNSSLYWLWLEYGMERFFLVYFFCGILKAYHLRQKKEELIFWISDSFYLFKF